VAFDVIAQRTPRVGEADGQTALQADRRELCVTSALTAAVLVRPLGFQTLTAGHLAGFLAFLTAGINNHLSSVWVVCLLVCFRSNCVFKGKNIQSVQRSNSVAILVQNIVKFLFVCLFVLLCLVFRDRIFICSWHQPCDLPAPASQVLEF
jgi:hypothetical protein